MVNLDPKKIQKSCVYFIEKVIYAGTKYNLTGFQKEWIDLCQKHKRLTLMAFRSSGKTRQMIVHHALWRAICNPGTEYLIISKTLPQAIKILKDIRTTLVTIPLLKSVIPSNRSQSWSRTEIELANHSSIKARAYNENVRGEHVDGVYCDEIGEYDDHEILKKAIFPTIRAKRGQFIGLGTPKSELDLLHAIERDPGFASIYFDRYPAEKDGNNLFEERYPDTQVVHKEGAVHVIDKKTQMTIETYNTMTWSQEFLLKPVSMEDKLFPDHMVQACLDPTLTFQKEVLNLRQYFMGVDFAMSAQSGSDYTVITVIEKSPGDKRLKLVWMDRFKGLNYNSQKDRIIEIAERYQVIKILADEGSFGKTFIFDLRQEGMPIEGYRFTYQSNSKEELIKALRDQFEKQGFIFPYSQEDVKTYTMVNALIDELLKFGIIFDMKKKQVRFEGTGKHDDCVISLGLCNFIARHITTSLFSVSTSRERRSQSNPFAVSGR